MGSETLCARRQEYALSKSTIQHDGGRAHGNWNGVEHRATQLPGAYPEALEGQGGRRPSGLDRLLAEGEHGSQGIGSELGGEVKRGGGLDSGNL